MQWSRVLDSRVLFSNVPRRVVSVVAGSPAIAAQRPCRRHCRAHRRCACWSRMPVAVGGERGRLPLAITSFSWGLRCCVGSFANHIPVEMCGCRRRPRCLPMLADQPNQRVTRGSVRRRRGALGGRDQLAAPMLARDPGTQSASRGWASLPPVRSAASGPCQSAKRPWAMLWRTLVCLWTVAWHDETGQLHKDLNHFLLASAGNRCS